MDMQVNFYQQRCVKKKGEINTEKKESKTGVYENSYQESKQILEAKVSVV